MYLCNVCGTVFEKTVHQYGVCLEHFGYPCREEFDVCPQCGSDDIDTGAPCIACGAFVRMHERDEGFCPACALRIVKRFTAFVDTLSEEEKELLNNKYYGVDAFL